MCCVFSKLKIYKFMEFYKCIKLKISKSVSEKI